MKEDPILAVEIDQDGRLCVQPATQEFPYIYREAKEVGWDPVRRSLFGLKPREWTYPRWFDQIIAAAAEQGVGLVITPQTDWINAPASLRNEMGG